MPSVSINDAHPPYAQFFTRAMEDRQASIDAGHTVFKDVDFVAITPQGSKDRIERVASEWLAHIRRETRNQRFEEAWLEKYERAFRAYKDGQELPLEGTALAEWPVATPAQIRTLLAFGLRSVEDLARANEETIARLGMGGRALKDKAANWLATAHDVGKVSERISALEVENSRLQSENKSLAENCTLLQRQLDALQQAQAPKGKPAPSESKDVEF